MLFGAAPDREIMRRDSRSWFRVYIICTTLFFISPIAFAAPAPIDGKLYSELVKFTPEREIVEVDGVPCLKVYIPKGKSLSYFCRFVKYFDRNFFFYRQQIALINRLEPMAIVDGEDSLSTNVKFVYVPLNFSIRPKILPERIESVARSPQFILVDIGQQCLGLYEYGKLVHLFPISSGKNGTPAKKFVIQSKEQDHFSTKYDNAWMPYSLRLYGNYFLHGGILPSYAASHGCVRLIYENAVFVYEWAKVGTPGEVINRTASKQKEIAQNKDKAALRQKEAALIKARVPDEDEPDIKTIF